MGTVPANIGVLIVNRAAALADVPMAVVALRDDQYNFTAALTAILHGKILVPVGNKPLY